MLSFARGLHGDVFYIDDPFQDPENKLNITVIDKINERFRTNIMSMPKRDGELHVVGTPQTQQDFFFDRDTTARFTIKITPAIISFKDKIVLWPEWMSFSEHMLKKRELTARIYNQEYMCSPVYSEYSYFKKEDIDRCINRKLNNLKELKTNNDVVLGWDLGKKNHPSHIAIFEKRRNRLIQTYTKFLDGVDYTEQVQLVKELWDRFGITRGRYDDTRGELEAFKEQYKLPHMLEGINFTQKTKYEMATSFARYIENEEIELIPDRRQIEQIMLVDNDLKAIETPDGHGDSFWSIALACYCAEDLGTFTAVAGLDEEWW
jgi:phage FluMu gp28-like protein